MNFKKFFSKSKRFSNQELIEKIVKIRDKKTRFEFNEIEEFQNIRTLSETEQKEIILQFCSILKEFVFKDIEDDFSSELIHPSSGIKYTLLIQEVLLSFPLKYNAKEWVTLFKRYKTVSDEIKIKDKSYYFSILYFPINNTLDQIEANSLQAQPIIAHFISSEVLSWDAFNIDDYKYKSYYTLLARLLNLKGENAQKSIKDINVFGELLLVSNSYNNGFVLNSFEEEFNQTSLPVKKQLVLQLFEVLEKTLPNQPFDGFDIQLDESLNTIYDTAKLLLVEDLSYTSQEWITLVKQFRNCSLKLEGDFNFSLLPLKEVVKQLKFLVKKEGVSNELLEFLIEAVTWKEFESKGSSYNTSFFRNGNTTKVLADFRKIIIKKV